MTFLAIGVVYSHFGQADRRAGPPVIVAALLLDVVFLAASLGQAAKWVIPTLVVSRRDAKT
jgi:hypothetical protein